MRTLLERGITFLVVIVVLIWGGYHASRYAQNSMQLETVFQDTISRSLVGKAVAIREEQPLHPEESSTPRFLYEDGARVGIGQPIVEYYSGTNNDRSLEEIRHLEEEIKLLLDAQNKNTNNFASAPTISRDIREQFSLVTQMAATGRCDELTNVYRELRLLVNCREIATGKSQHFQSRINFLRSETEELRAKSDFSNLREGYTPVSGYFVKDNDGFETKLSPATMSSLTISDFLDLAGQEPSAINSNGCIVTSSKWYLAVCVPVHQVEWVGTGQHAMVNIIGTIEEFPARVSGVLIENNSDTAVVILASDYISADILNLRTAEVNLAFSQFAGLKINSSYIHFRQAEDGAMERGVYVLENYVVKFKRIETIYEEPSFVISKMNYADTGDKTLVRLFDQIIVQGNDLYEGKVID